MSLRTWWSHAARAPEHQPFDSFASIRWSWTWDLVALLPRPDAPARSAAAVGHFVPFSVMCLSEVVLGWLVVS